MINDVWMCLDIFRWLLFVNNRGLTVCIWFVKNLMNWRGSKRDIFICSLSLSFPDSLVTIKKTYFGKKTFESFIAGLALLWRACWTYIYFCITEFFVVWFCFLFGELVLISCYFLAVYASDDLLELTIVAFYCACWVLYWISGVGSIVSSLYPLKIRNKQHLLFFTLIVSRWELHQRLLSLLLAYVIRSCSCIALVGLDPDAYVSGWLHTHIRIPSGIHPRWRLYVHWRQLFLLNVPTRLLLTAFPTRPSEYRSPGLPS